MKCYLALPLAGSIFALCLAFSGASQAAAPGVHHAAPASAHTSSVAKANWRQNHHPRYYRHYRNCRWHHHHRYCR